MIPKNPCGFIDNNCNGRPVRAEVSHLQSLKAAVQKKISDGRYFAFNPIPHYGYYKIRPFFGILFSPPLEDNFAHSTLT